MRWLTPETTPYVPVHVDIFLDHGVLNMHHLICILLCTTIILVEDENTTGNGGIFYFQSQHHIATYSNSEPFSKYLYLFFICLHFSFFLYSLLHSSPGVLHNWFHCTSSKLYSHTGCPFMYQCGKGEDLRDVYSRPHNGGG